MVCLACRGALIVENRQRNTNAERCRETCASACLLSCVSQGVADTTSTKFFFPKKIQTPRDDDTRINMCWFSEEGFDSTCSTNHDTGTAAPPNCIQSHQPEFHPMYGRTCSTSFEDNSINGISHVVQLDPLYKTDLTSACSAFRALSGHNTLYSVPRPACFLEAECHDLHRHVTPDQISAWSLFARRAHSPDDMMWWRAATLQVLMGGATCAAQISTDPIDSGTWPYQLQEPHTHK